MSRKSKESLPIENVEFSIQVPPGEGGAALIHPTSSSDDLQIDAGKSSGGSADSAPRYVETTTAAAAAAASHSADGPTAASLDQQQRQQEHAARYHSDPAYQAWCHQHQQWQAYYAQQQQGGLPYPPPPQQQQQQQPSGYQAHSYVPWPQQQQQQQPYGSGVNQQPLPNYQQLQQQQQQQQQGYPLPPQPTLRSGKSSRRQHQRGNSSSSAPPNLSPTHRQQQQQQQYSTSSGMHQQPPPSQPMEGNDVYAALLQSTGKDGIKNYGAFTSKSPRPFHAQPQQQQPQPHYRQAGLPPSRSRNNLQEFLIPVSQPSPPPPPPNSRKHHHHHRSSSDSKATSGKNSHRRSNSDTMRRMQQHSNSRTTRTKIPTDPMRTRKKYDAVPMQRGRSHSFGNSNTGSNNSRPGSPSLRRPTHRRNSSMASQVSVMSEASMRSFVSDIRKSSFFGGVTGGSNDNGTAQLHFPFENVHLVPTQVLYPALEVGHLYSVAVDAELYEEYHRAAEDTLSLDDDDDDIDDDMGDKVLQCRCSCPNCATCSHKKALLPPNYFLLGVEDNLYRRVVDEICASQSMPCGLFFCGHHEDISHPSIAIAIVLLLAVFCFMAYVASFV